MPLNFEEDAKIEDEGMIGKIINDARKNHNESKDAYEKNQVGIRDAHEKIEAIQEKLDELRGDVNKRMD